MGRNAKPIQLQLLEGNKVRKSKAELERLEKNDAKLQFNQDEIKAPAWLKA